MQGKQQLVIISLACDQVVGFKTMTDSMCSCGNSAVGYNIEGMVSMLASAMSSPVRMLARTISHYLV